MLLSEAVANLDLLLDIDLDNFNGLSATSQQKCDALWEDAKLVCAEAQVYMDSATLTPSTSDQIFELKSSETKIPFVFRRIESVIVAGNQITLYSWDDFKARFPDYRTVDAGQPVACAVSPGRPNRALVFDRAFDATAAALTTHYISGWGYPRLFSYAGDSASEWTMPEALRWANIKRTAYRLGSPFAKSPSAVATLGRYLAEAAVDIEKYSEEQGDLTSPLEGYLESPVCDRIGF